MEGGRSLKAAAKDFGIPPTSLRGHIMGTTSSHKREEKAIMTEQEEVALVKYVKDMCNYAHPLNMSQLIFKVAELTQYRETPFTNWYSKTWLVEMVL
jgi:hypothetical protein